ncbi:hypothetical protein [Methylomarinum vadi]|uniref:hypothetical protein n=1 Tax=Methylomarinum vadi TaxID=438855 RepID=UPI0012696757|nr:hypothetical protein [Methylomarinum vadi]
MSSNTFASNAAIDRASQGLSTLNTKPLAFVQNAINWSLEDRGLLALQGRMQLAVTLDPMPDDEQRIWGWPTTAWPSSDYWPCVAGAAR